jgi:hypothetical protein
MRSSIPGRLRRSMQALRSGPEQGGPGGSAGGGPGAHQHPRLRRRIEKLEKEVAGLREELLEQRLVSHQVAELSDLLTSLIGAAARGPEEFDQALAAYADEVR